MQGKISVFNDHEIGGCGRFDLGNGTEGNSIKMILKHEGSRISNTFKNTYLSAIYVFYSHINN